VGQELRAEQLRGHDLAAKPVLGRHISRERRVLELLRTDAEADRLAGIAVEPWARTVLVTRRADIMGVLVNRRVTTLVTAGIAALIIALNAYLLWATFA